MRMVARLAAVLVVMLAATVPQMWHFMSQRFPNSGWKRLACWVAPCTVQVAHGVWRHRDAGVLPRVAGSN
jgi:hypothetical protein